MINLQVTRTCQKLMYHRIYQHFQNYFQLSPPYTTPLTQGQCFDALIIPLVSPPQCHQNQMHTKYLYTPPSPPFYGAIQYS